jgi:hypothetical protein
MFLEGGPLKWSTKESVVFMVGSLVSLFLYFGRRSQIPPCQAVAFKARWINLANSQATLLKWI